MSEPFIEVAIYCDTVHLTARDEEKLQASKQNCEANAEAKGKLESYALVSTSRDVVRSEEQQPPKAHFHVCPPNFPRD